MRPGRRLFRCAKSTSSDALDLRLPTGPKSVRKLVRRGTPWSKGEQERRNSRKEKQGWASLSAEPRRAARPALAPGLAASDGTTGEADETTRATYERCPPSRWVLPSRPLLWARVADLFLQESKVGSGKAPSRRRSTFVLSTRMHSCSMPPLRRRDRWDDGLVGLRCSMLTALYRGARGDGLTG